MDNFDDIMQDLFDKMCNDPELLLLYLKDDEFDIIIQNLFVYAGGPDTAMDSFSYNGPFGPVEIIRGHERFKIGYEDAAEFF